MRFVVAFKILLVMPASAWAGAGDDNKPDAYAFLGLADWAAALLAALVGALVGGIGTYVTAAYLKVSAETLLDRDDAGKSHGRFNRWRLARIGRSDFVRACALQAPSGRGQPPPEIEKAIASGTRPVVLARQTGTSAQAVFFPASLCRCFLYLERPWATLDEIEDGLAKVVELRRLRLLEPDQARELGVWLRLPKFEIGSKQTLRNIRHRVDTALQAQGERHLRCVMDLEVPAPLAAQCTPLFIAGPGDSQRFQVAFEALWKRLPWAPQITDDRHRRAHLAAIPEELLVRRCKDIDVASTEIRLRGPAGSGKTALAMHLLEGKLAARTCKLAVPVMQDVGLTAANESLRAAVLELAEGSSESLTALLEPQMHLAVDADPVSRSAARAVCRHLLEDDTASVCVLLDSLEHDLEMLNAAKKLRAAGFQLVATARTTSWQSDKWIPVAPWDLVEATALLASMQKLLPEQRSTAADQIERLSANRDRQTYSTYFLALVAQARGDRDFHPAAEAALFLQRELSDLVHLRVVESRRLLASLQERLRSEHVTVDEIRTTLGGYTQVVPTALLGEVAWLTYFKSGVKSFGLSTLLAASKSVKPELTQETASEFLQRACDLGIVGLRSGLYVWEDKLLRDLCVAWHIVATRQGSEEHQIASMLATITEHGLSDIASLLLDLPTFQALCQWLAVDRAALPAIERLLDNGYLDVVRGSEEIRTTIAHTILGALPASNPEADASDLRRIAAQLARILEPKGDILVEYNGQPSELIAAWADALLCRGDYARWRSRWTRATGRTWRTITLTEWPTLDALSVTQDVKRIALKEPREVIEFFMATGRRDLGVLEEIARTLVNRKEPTREFNDEEKLLASALAAALAKVARSTPAAGAAAPDDVGRWTIVKGSNQRPLAIAREPDVTRLVAVRLARNKNRLRWYRLPTEWELRLFVREQPEIFDKGLADDDQIYLLGIDDIAEAASGNDTEVRWRAVVDFAALLDREPR